MSRRRSVPSSARFIELTSPELALVRALGDAGIGASLGATFTFLGILVLGLVGEEALSAFYRDLDLDPLFRSSMGGLLVVALGLGATVPWLFLIERFVVLQVAEAQAETGAESAVPASAFRDRLATVPGAGMTATGMALALTFGLLAVICLGMVVFSEDLREDGFAAGAFGVFAALAAASIWMQHAGERGRRAREPRVLALREQWNVQTRRAEEADAQRREDATPGQLPSVLRAPSSRVTALVARAVLTVTGIATAGFILSVFLRQQCRECEPVTWSDPIENGIDGLSLVTGSMLVLCGVVGIVLLFAGLVLRFVRERALARWTVAGEVRRVDPDLIRPYLAGPRASEVLARVLGALGAAALILGIGVAWSGWRDADPTYLLLAGAALIPLGVLVSLADAGRGTRERQQIREATAPGDLEAVVTAAAAKRRRQRSR